MYITSSCYVCYKISRTIQTPKMKTASNTKTISKINTTEDDLKNEDKPTTSTKFVHSCVRLKSLNTPQNLSKSLKFLKDHLKSLKLLQIM